jgi:hypothetical protein
VSDLAEALVAAQADLPCALGKDATGQIGQRSYKYLTLDKLIAETRPILTAHGLAILQHPSTLQNCDENGRANAHVPSLTTTLLHVSGDVRTWTMPLYLADKSMQGLGAAITYARRYAWAAVLGIAAEEDMDAPAAEEVPF